jgi:MYXO-CTERM domain-containing protein
MRAAGLPLACLSFLLSCGAADTQTGGRGRELPLNGGAPDNGYPGTVMMYWTDGLSGSLCSGTVVAPRVIVSAKHCYLATGAAGWTANTGPTGENQSLGVTDVLQPDGLELLNEDIAVVLVGADLNVDAVDIRRDFSGLRQGDSAIVVGYGENSDDGENGRKYSGDAAIMGFGPIDEAGVGDQEMLLEGAAACGGDSGGSTLDGNGDLIGVIVRGADVACNESTFTVSTRIDGFLELIDQGIQQSQGCVPTGEEVCNFVDDDCDGQMDEVCSMFGGPCTTYPCQPGFVCTPIAGAGEPKCTLPCNPATPIESCPLGSYCFAYACGVDGGHCVFRGAEAPGAVGAPCAQDGDCLNLYCRDPADGGGQRCMVRCEDDAVCGAGSVCAPVPQGCGGCVPEAGDPLLGSFGQPCDTDDQCASGLCGADADGTFCTQACGDCPAGYHCAREECARGEESDDQGRPCADNPDCLTGLCAHWPEGSSCTTFCSDADPCPEGLSCTDVGDGRRACKPDKTIVGEPCESNEQCMSSLCGAFPDDRGTVCTEPCAGGACPVGLECLEASGLTLCAPPSVPPEKATYGCGCTVPPPPREAPVALLGVVGLMLFRRRSRPQSVSRTPGPSQAVEAAPDARCADDATLVGFGGGATTQTGSDRPPGDGRDSCSHSQAR